MKAYYVHHRDGYVGEIHWGATPGKAKLAALRLSEWISNECDWIDIRARRAPKFDGEPREVTCHDWIAAGYTYDCDLCPKDGCEERMENA